MNEILLPPGGGGGCMTLKPLRNYVVIKQARLPEKVGSLHLPENYRKALPYAEVLEVGPEVQSVKVGDGVYFFTEKAACVPCNNDMVLVIPETDINCIVEGVTSDIISNLALTH